MTPTYGLLLNREDILLQRSYFNELVTLIGVKLSPLSSDPSFDSGANKLAGSIKGVLVIV